MANIGFISTRFAGTDGVSLESEKWASLLEETGNKVFWFAGQLDRDAEKSMLVPEAFFEHPANVEINKGVWGKVRRKRSTTEAVAKLASAIKPRIYEFVSKFDIEIVVAENCLAIPMHIPLAVALTEFLAETGMQAIAHHHDFYWERTRFLVNAARDYLDMAFPPSLQGIQHVVINSAAQDELAWRKGLSSIVVPNVLEFERPPGSPERPLEEIRREMGLSEGDLLFLQPTRVVPRKGIEHAIAILSRLKDQRCKLIVSHESGDEGGSYVHALQDMARDAKVDMRLVVTRIPNSKDTEEDRRSRPSLWDVYRCADFITYPSLYEGFGNALLEAFYFKKPVLVNRYSIWVRDIEPKGFRCVNMEGIVTSETVEDVRRLLADKTARDSMVKRNYMLATRHFSYSVLRRGLRTLIVNIVGLEQLLP
ncbi:MAG: glycosyltransferase [Lentisphaerales bacterium]|nr:MAG: glycosyltransferase [Lentisphaerales bacterium]